MSDKAISTQPDKCILIVDDSEDMRHLLQQILEEEEGYSLRFAETGPQALVEAAHTQPDLILLDMSLPEMSGWEVVTRLRSLNEFAHTPIIAVTAHVSKDDQDRALALGCTAHLGKPFDVFAVADMIAQLLESKEEDISA